MLKREELDNEESCLNKAKFDEPIFVLRAQDRLAPLIIRLWAELVSFHSSNNKKVANDTSFH